jgi:hypothetical protein
MRVITREEYRQMKRHDYAGTKASLLPATRATWPAEATHWSLQLTDAGTTLVPTRIEG